MQEHGDRDNDGGYFGNGLVVSIMCGCGVHVWAVVEVMDHDQTGQIIRECWGRTDEHALSRSDQSPSKPPSPSMTDEPKPIRVNHLDAHIPAPSEKNIESLAMKGWIDYSGQMSRIVDHDMPSWDELDDRLRQVWINVARGQHVVMTLLGGGKIETIEDAE